MARQLKEGDRLIDWDGDTGVAKDVEEDWFIFQGYVCAAYWAKWTEFNAGIHPLGTFRFADTEYPEWPL